MSKSFAPLKLRLTSCCKNTSWIWAYLWILIATIILQGVRPIQAEAAAYQGAPVNGALSSGYGWRWDPMGKGERFHAGVDIAAAYGSPVFPCQDGIVIFSGPYHGYGNLIVMQHAPQLYTLYGHNARLLVKAGQWAQRNQPIALVGSTGRSTGPHLHFEVRYRNRYLNPLSYLSYLSQQNLAYSMPVTQPVLRQQQAGHGTNHKVGHTRAKQHIELISGGKIQHFVF